MKRASLVAEHQQRYQPDVRFGRTTLALTGIKLPPNGKAWPVSPLAGPMREPEALPAVTKQRAESPLIPGPPTAIYLRRLPAQTPGRADPAVGYPNRTTWAG